MKYEPLKLKDLKQNVREIFADKEKFAYIQNSARRKMDHEYGFLHAISIVEGRVKSAVQGLLEEIGKMEKFYENMREQHREDKELNHVFTAKRDTVSRIKNKIKKWFADVINKEEER